MQAGFNKEMEKMTMRGFEWRSILLHRALLVAIVLLAGTLSYSRPILNSGNDPMVAGAIDDQVEFLALKTFYDSLGGSGWTNKSNWPIPGNWPASATVAEMSTWYGVSFTNGDVSGLSMAGNNLVGKIPAAISDLRGLVTLSLPTNSITKIPSAINELTNLTTILLNNNLLTGGLPDLTGLVQLSQLDLKQNPTLTLAPIPTWIGSLTNLKILDLSNTKRNGAIPSFIGNLTKLTTLNLNTNQLTGAIPSELVNDVDLVIVNMYGNQLSGGIPSGLGSLIKVTQLNLSSNQLSGNLTEGLFSGMVNMNLLNLSNNQLSGMLPSSMGGMTKLANLDISVNQFTGALPATFSALNKLTLFNIQNNQLSGELPASLFSTWTVLSSISLQQNAFTGPFPSSIGNCTSLTYLRADLNKFTTLPASMLNLPSVTTLFFRDNELKTIPDFGGQVNKANLALTIGNNRLDFSQLEQLIGTGIKTVNTPLTQNTINDFSQLYFPVDAPLVITTRPTGGFSTVTWEKQNANATWSAINTDQDNIPQTYTRNAMAFTDEGNYRWKMTNSKVTGVTLQSEAINVMASSLTISSATIIPSSVDNVNGGSIQLVVSGGTTPYAYNWSSGETTSSISNKAKGAYTVTVTDAGGVALTRSYNLGYKMEWTDLVNVTIATDNSLNKTGTTLAWDAGTGSYNLLPANTDGWMEFVVNTSGDEFVYGLSSSNIGVGNYQRLNYALNITTTNDIVVMESGMNQGKFGKMREGDVFRISREGSNIKYYRNGLVFRTIANATNVPLQVGSSISKIHAPVVTSSFAPELKVTATIAAGLTTGGISVSVQGGTTPYTYSWNSGEMASSISNKAKGVYTVTVTDAEGIKTIRSYNLGYKMEWADLINVTVAADNSLNKTVNNVSWDAATGSYNLLPANTDGWMEFAVNTLGNVFIYGYCSSSSISAASPQRLNYYIYILANNDIQLVENGTRVGTYGKVREGDVFRISREGGNINYYRNGEIFRNTPNALSSALQVGSSIFQTLTPIPIVTSSFAPELKVTATIAAGLTTGGISVSVQGGIAPYTYSWSSGETTSSISNKAKGMFTVTVTDNEGTKSTRSYNLGYKMEWADLVGVTVAADNSLNKTSTSKGWDAGTGSYNLLPANTDGWMEFVVNILGDAFGYGLSSSNIGVTYQKLNYGLNISAANDIVVIENNVNQWGFGKTREGDVFRISREGSTIKYYRNGVVFKTTPNAINVPLQVGSSISNAHAPVVTSSFAPELKVTATIAAGLTTGGITVSVQGGTAPYTYSWSSGETTSSISNKAKGAYTLTVTDAEGTKTTRSYNLGYKTEWTDLVNVTVAADNSLNKTGTALAWDAGSGSYNLLPANTDGWLEFVVNNLGDIFTYGFSSSNIGTGNYGRLNYAIQILANNDIQIFEGTTQIGATGATYGKVREGDVFRISREGSTIKYYRNGVVLRTSTNATNVPLQVGSSIYKTHAPVVTSSFAPELKVTATIAAGLTTGGITVSVQGGTAPYTYSWSSGETISSISNKVRGTYTVTVADAAGATSTRTYSLGYKTEWTDLVNVTVATDNSLNKTGTALAWDAGSGSYNLLPANTDGWLEFVVNNLGDIFTYGFSSSNIGTGNYGRLNYAIQILANNDIQIFEGTTPVGSYGKVREGDVFRISREGSTIKYYRNGVVLRTTPNATNVPLQMGSSIAKTHAPVVTSSFAPELKVTAAIAAGLTTGGITLSVQGGIAPYTYSWNSGETTSSISNKVRGTYTVTVADAAGATSTRTYSLGYKTEWTDLVNVTVAADNSLNKTGTALAWDAGSGSYNLLSANTDGSMEFVVNTLGDIFTYGFSSSSIGTGNYGRLNYAIQILANNDIQIFEGTTQIGATGATYGKVREGDVFRISREGSTIKYYRNGVLLRTTPNATNVPLQMGSSIAKTHAPVVTSSFAPELKVTAAIAAGLTTGGITLSVQGGIAPYTYSWNSGETTSSISNKVRGTYIVTVADAAGATSTRTYGLGYKTEWTDLKNLTVAADNSLNKTGTSQLWDAGSGTSNVLQANADGWLEFVVNSLGDVFMYGLTPSNVPVGTGSYQRLSYSIYITAANDVGIYEGSTSRGLFGKVRQGDVFRISREGSSIKYYQNGVLFRTAANALSSALQVGSSISRTHAPIVTASFWKTLPLAIASANIIPLTLKDNDGGIQVTVSGGTAPYTYLWSSGEATAAIASKPLGAYSITVTDALGQTLSRPYHVGYEVEWSQLEGVSKNNGELMKTAPPGWGNGGADSGNLLESGTDGWIEFILTREQGEYALGFGERGSSFNYPAVLQGFQVSQTGVIAFLELAGSVVQRIEIGPYQTGDVVRIQRANGEVSYFYNGQLLRTSAVDSRELIVKAVNYSGSSPRAIVSFLTERARITQEISNYQKQVHKLPDVIKITRDGRKLKTPFEPPFAFNALMEDEPENVFVAPPCLEGNFYVGFKLSYDLGNEKTEADWVASLEVTLLHGSEVLWTRPLQINMREQTFEAITFHDMPVSCDADYQFIIRKKTVVGEVPKENINLVVLLHHIDEAPFSVTSPITNINCTNSSSASQITWDHSMNGTIAYDVEWVFIDDEESTQAFQPDKAFAFNEPVRVTLAGRDFGSSLTNYLYFYPKGRVWHRIRAVGYNAAFPEHRINGQWNYGCSAMPVDNQEPDKNWARQTVFAEDGKFKEVVRYYDATSRERQVVTNLSTEQVNVVGETHYDFEGRPAVQILPVPSTDLSLKFKPGFNQYVSTDPIIQANTSASQNKFNYDNRRLENGVLEDSSGAGAYYSPSHPFDSFRKDYIPKADGFVYSQSEFTNDGTGRVTRQSGVGNEFRLDGNHTTQSFYATASTSELVRLFGSNAGNAAHYRKTALLDPNGQASITYTDQEGRTIATALAGNPPAASVDALKSFTLLSGDLFTNDISNKNTKSSSGSQISHIFLNLVYETPYTFQYSLSAMASQVEEFGCQDCNYDVKITITDPEGDLVDLSEAPGNESINGDKSYQRKDINASCTVPTTVDNISIPVRLEAAGEYTITKTLVAHEQSFAQMKATLLQDASVQTTIQQLQSSYTVNPLDCDICFTCEEAEEAINEAIDEIATLDCDNIYQLIVSELKKAYEDAHPDDDDDYEPLETDIKAHPKYCQYEKCTKDKESDVFDKQLARIADWSTAVTNNRTNLFASDPFFNDPALSGSAGTIHSAMETRLGNLSIGNISYDNNNDNIPDGAHDFRGSLNQVTDPENTTFYIDDRGNANVNGYHILYYDLMSKRAALGDTEYFSQLNQQRWVFYLNFYLESKRVTKKEAYAGCASMVAQLGTSESIPTTETGIRDWAKQNGLGGDVSDIEVESGLQSIQMSCGTTLMNDEKNTIRTHLKAYYNSTPDNHLRLILLPGLEDVDHGGSWDLGEIENILQSHGCTLHDIAVEDPAACAESITIVVPGGLPLEVPRILKDEIGTENARIAANELSIEQQKTVYSDSPLFKNQISENVETSFDKDQALANRVALSNSTNSTSAAELIPQSEYNALIAIYQATGAQWQNNFGWSNAVINGTPDVGGWSYVDTEIMSDGLRHVSNLELFDYGLTGVIPADISNLSYLKGLLISVSSNSSLSLNLSVIATLGNLTDLDLSVANTTGNISNLSGLINLRKIHLSLYNISGDISSFSGLTNLETLQLYSGNILTGNISSLEGLKKLSVLNLDYFLNLSGSVSSIGKLTSLTDLYISRVSLNGSITSLSPLIKLEKLSLNSVGPLPGDIALLSPLKAMTDFYLSGINVSGDIEVFSNWNNLSSLEISPVATFQLTGNLNAFAGLSELKKLSIPSLIVSNSITGSLEDLSGNLKLEYLNLTGIRLLGSQLTSLPLSIKRLYLASCSLSGDISVVNRFPALSTIALSYNEFFGNFPPFHSSAHLEVIDLRENLLTGYIPTSIVSSSIYGLDVSGNKFTFSHVLDVSRLLRSRFNSLSQKKVDDVKVQMANVGATIILSTIIDTNTTPASVYKWYKNNVPIGNAASITLNNLQEADNGAVFYYTITNPDLPQLTLYSNNQTLAFSKADQTISFSALPTATVGDPSFTLNATASSGLPVTFTSSNTAVATISGSTLTIVGQGTSVITASQAGNSSYNAAPDVTQTLTTMRQDQTFVICQTLNTDNSVIKSFTYEVDWAAEIAKCNARAAEQRIDLIALAEEKLWEEIISRYVNTFGTRCMENVNESLTYSYLDKEYHHTLYYYDQSGSLVQTVPPEGVRALNAAQVTNFVKGIKTEPAHALVTNYAYNSLGQLSRQQTPDAGESKFVYDNKGQLRVSQNAQQIIGSLFSYTRYDEQGRIAEVGETNLPYTITDKVLADSTQTLRFPNTLYHPLTDVTRTHYDFADASIMDGFTQNYLRSRVSWVEVFEADANEAVKTHYNYDIHGNVTSLQQRLPGMSAKRTDYVYDLISGKVNYVMYQYGKPDQFIHEYDYDADNRLRNVFTSRDGYLWSKEAGYDYYLHGPLARTELGHYRVQGLDYHYTLQGWIKGVNMPYAGDPGTDGLNGTKTGKDVFAYTLGYYNGDYSPIGSALTQSDSRDHLWNRALENIQHTGLYNGNISFMVTDLPKIGEQQNDRAKGMQGMLYRYDQLHRITKSRSLTSYNESNGFAARATAASYDEDYTYDANGNILSLKRKDELAVLKDDFTYDYYAGTNKLKNVKATQTQNYSYDAIGNLVTDAEEGVAISWTPYGKIRSVQKGDSVTMSYRYDASGNRVEKKVVKGDSTDVTRYLRDASGNVLSIYKIRKPLGTDIEWKTKVAVNYVNGSVVPVTAGTVGVIVSQDWAEDNNPVELAFTATGLGFKVAFLQDGTSGGSPVFPFFIFSDTGMTRFLISSTGGADLLAGQYKAGDRFRIRKEKDKVHYYLNQELLYSFSLTAPVTVYRAFVVTDEVMQNFVFIKGNDTARQIEVPLYGSARLGQFRGEIIEGHRTLGHRNYELSNHLGNVLAVITDNAGMKPNEVWASVVSTSDYYPFGLEMKGRSYSDAASVYRYGFNGKEKDNFNATVYDYGFRIYNPEIAKFLSVDPLTKSYPELTPYQFASNTPIMAIDLDGLEASLSIHPPDIKEGITKTDKDEIEKAIYNPILIKVAEARPEEETAGGKAKLFFTTLGPISRSYFMDEMDQFDSDYGLEGFVAEPGGRTYFDVNSKGQININNPQREPMLTSNGLIRVGGLIRSANGAIQLARAASGTPYLVHLVYKTNIIKNSNLKNVMRAYVRNGASLGNGGSADVLMNEAATGKMNFSQAGHLQKVVQLRSKMYEILKNESLTSKERRMVIKELSNIQQALKFTFGSKSKYPYNEAAKQAINMLNKQPNF